jgi:hypothetical protein
MRRRESRWCRLGHEGYRSGSGILRVRARGRDPEFLDRVQTRLHARHAAAETVNERNPVQGHLRGTDLHAVNPGIAATFHARCEGEQVCNGASVQRQLLDA